MQGVAATIGADLIGIVSYLFLGGVVFVGVFGVQVPIDCVSYRECNGSHNSRFFDA